MPVRRALMWNRKLNDVRRELYGTNDDEDDDEQEVPQKKAPKAPGVKVHGDAAAQSRLGHMNLLGVLGRIPGAVRIRKGPKPSEDVASIDAGE